MAKLARGQRSDDVVVRNRASLDFLPLVCAGAAVCCGLFILVALGSREWIQGTAKEAGDVKYAFVGLGSVRIGSDAVGLHKLCPHPANMTVPDKFATTPPAIWCMCREAGTWAAWLLWLSFIPLSIAGVLSAAEGLASVSTQAREVKLAVTSMGFDQRSQGFLLVGCWAATWALLFLGLLTYAAMVPDTLGWGTVDFEASFGLVRLSFLLVTMCTAVIAAKALKLWHEENFMEALGDFLDARGVRQSLYLLLFGQLALFLLISVNDLYWQGLIPLFGLYYLDTEKTNFLVLYLTVLVMTLLFDMIHFLGLPRFGIMEGKKAFAESIYIVIFMSKFACIVLFGMLKREELQANQYPQGDNNDPEIAE
mmetsp:Transcript_8570/g.29261  ORF Transcript_8570/g.29261 Transcript_8570/m.29261 type:complete len:366 (-) Transcript_8570:153-1250(-)